MLKGILSKVLLVLVLALGAGSSAAANCASTGGNWATAGTWTSCGGLTPQPGDDVTITSGTVILDTSVTVASLTVNGTLTFGNSTTVRTLSVSGNVTVAGTINHSANNAVHLFNIGGNLSNSGTMTLTTANRTIDITLNGTATQAIGGGSSTTTFNNLTITNISAAVSSNTNFNIAATLNMNGAATLLTPAAAVVINNAAAAGTLIGTGTVQVTKTGADAFKTQYKFTTYTTTNLTVEYIGAAAQTASSGPYGNLKINNASGVTLTVATTVNNNLTIASGTLDDGDFQITGNAAGVLSMASGTGLIIGNGATNRTFPTLYTNANITLTAGSTVTYKSTAAAQVISSVPTYANLTLGSTAAVAKAPNGNTTVNGTLTINASNTFTAGTNTYTLNGDFTNNGTFTSGTSTVQFTSTSTKQTITGATSFNRLIINNTSAVAGNKGVTLASNTTVTTLLTLTAGVVTTGANNLIVTTVNCAVPSVARTSGWVSGNLQKHIPAAASACTFEVGGASVYAPINATFAAGAAAANITAITTDGDHASIATSGLDPDLTANRSWSLTSTVAEATAFSTVFNFDATDLDTDTQPATLFKGRQFSSAAWTTPTTGTLTATSTQLTGLTLAAATQKDFVVGEVARTSGTGSFNAVENIAATSAAAGDAITGKIYTKLAGTAFTIDLVALNAARTAVDSTFKGVVKVELLDSSSGGALDANGCNAGWPTIQTLGTTPQFLAADSGRKQNVSFTETNAWPNVRVRVTYPDTGAAVLIGCSINNFSIRPSGFTNISFSITNGTSKAIAGSDTFTLTAATGLTGYTGTAATPKIDNTAVQAHANAIQNGSVSGGSFPAAVSGTSTGTNLFTYSEVGNFKFLGYDPTTDAASARGVYDDNFTAVDNSVGDCTADFSNVLVGGKYGCKFGITADTGFFGRFYPKDFLLTVGVGALTNRKTATSTACSPVSTFTYAGEQMMVTFTLTARNGASVTTQNYKDDTVHPAASFAALDASVIANLGFGAVDLADAIAPLTATALTSSLTLGTSSGTWASGSVTVTAYLALTRAASPNGPFESFNLGIDPADTDGVKLNGYNLDTDLDTTNDHGLVGTSKIRYGRLRLLNAYGSPLLPLQVPVRAEYYNGTGWALNSSDTCTTFITSNVSVGGANPSGTTAPTVSSVTDGSAGTWTVKLTPNANVFSSFDMALNLGTTGTPQDNSCNATHGGTAANLPWLQYAWCTGKTDPNARVKFGSSKTPFIYLRERY